MLSMARLLCNRRELVATVLRASGRLQRVASLGLALVLAACAGVEVKMPSTLLELPQVERHVPADELEALKRATPCCGSLADLPYRRLEREGPITVEIGPDSPAFVFDGGKSFFAAFRLPDWPRPLALRLRSRGPLAVYDPGRPIFSPAVFVLDAQFRARRVMQGSGEFQVVQLGSGSGQTGIQMEGDLYIGESAQDAAYLIVLTTDELRERSFVSNGQRVHGFSPLGTIDLEVRSAPFLAVPVHYRGPAMLMEPGRPLSGDLSLRFNTLFIDGSGLHYVEEVDGRWLERLWVPSTSLVAARVHVPFALNPRLELDTAQGPDAPLVRRTFTLLPPLGFNAHELRHVAGLAAQGVTLGWHRERVAIVAATSAPVVEFRDAPPVPSEASKRIVDKAMTGGVVTAGVCGICMAGICPPQALLACAGLFAVGAAVGGAVGVGGELFAGSGQHAAPQAPTLPAQQVQSATPMVSSTAGVLMAQDALRACVLRRAGEGPSWVAQGRGAVLTSDTTSAPFVLETSVQRVALVPNSQPGQAMEEIPVQMVVEGRLLLRHTPPKSQESRNWQRTATWLGPSHTLGEWSAPDGRLLEAALRDACEGLAASLLREAQLLWEVAR